MMPIIEIIDGLYTEKSFHYGALDLPAFEHFWHAHPEMELTFIQKGEGMRYVGDSIQPFTHGDLVFLGSYLPHSWATYRSPTIENERVTAKFFQFPASLFLQFPEYRFLTSFFREANYGLYFANPSAALLNKIHDFGSFPRHLQILQLFDLILELFIQKKRVQISQKPARMLPGFQFLEKEEQRLARVLKWIHEQHATAITLDQAAKEAAMSKTYFCRWFSKINGCTFMQYLNRLRIEQACQMLVFSDKTVGEIAYASGFENISHFNRVFRGVKKQSPTALRQQASLR
ncbi:MAG: helix-turn-helix transcriptional regulator [Saprospiraceae bacterium]|nr:helix-turn-helix transcriptional regulator [Saprospiraceae bacterium]